MQMLQVIGNLGADAELRKEQGQCFVSLSIACSRKVKSSSGETKDVTDWVSATLNGDGGRLFPYLKRGTLVYATGEQSLRLFHSEKDRCMKAGVNLFIRHIELIGARPDYVPRTLYDKDGVAYAVSKFYSVTGCSEQCLYDMRGSEYQVLEGGWVFPLKPAVDNGLSNDETSTGSIAVTEQTTQNGAAESSDKTTNSKKVSK